MPKEKIYTNKKEFDKANQAYLDSLNLYDYTMLQKKLEKQSNFVPTGVMDLLTTGKSVKLNEEGEKAKKILNKEAKKILANNKNLTKGLVGQPIPTDEMYGEEGSYDIQSLKIKPKGTWKGTALNNDYSNVKPTTKPIYKPDVKPKLTNFEQRINKPTEVIKNNDGTVSTHKMMSFEADGKYYAAPTIVKQNGKLVELSQKDAINYAFKNNEFKEFKTDKEAKEYANNGYKKSTPLEAKPKVLPQNQRKPIIVNDPNDKRLKAYNDSLKLYDKANYFKNIGKFTPYINLKQRGRYFNDYLDNDFSDGFIAPIGARQSKDKNNQDVVEFPVYKKPVQPVIFEDKPKLNKIQSLPLSAIPVDNKTNIQIPTQQVTKPTTKVVDARTYTAGKYLKSQGKSSGYINEGDGTGRKEVYAKGGWLDSFKPPTSRIEAETKLDVLNNRSTAEKWLDASKAEMKKVNNTSEIYQSGVNKGKPTGKGALEPVYPEMMLMPGSLPIKAASKLGKAAVFAAEALNPIGGVKNLKSNVINKSASSVVENTAKQLSNSNNVASVINTIPNSWSMQELPGLHLKSTMSDGPISKIVEPKTGLINVEQALGIIGKESGGAEKLAIVKQGLGENIPKKMDYNEFRKTVQDQLIPLERQFATHASNYGVGSLGYPSPKRSSFESAIKHANIEKNKQLQIIKEYEGYLKNPSKYKKAFPYESNLNKTNDELIPHIKSTLDDYKQRLAASELQLSKNLEDMKQLPLENQTLILSNKGKFGRGSSAHGNPEETLGHIHFLRDAESPDILTVTQIQSDAFQGTHRIMPKNAPDVSKSQYSLQRMEELQNRNKSILNKMKTEGVDEAGVPVQDYQIKQFEDIVKAQEQSNLFKKAEIENFTQKQLLDKNHQERYLQELVNYAGERGDVTKLRLPTSETAAKIQGYKPIAIAEEIIKKHNELKGTPEWDEIMLNTPDADKVRLEKILKGELKGDIYELDRETILKKYREQPKMIKKLFGQDAKIVTDSKGNTWYEFNIPKSFKKGKGEIKAFGLIAPTAIMGAGALQAKDKQKYSNGGLLKRADGSYSERGLWDNIRDNRGSNKTPTKQMLEQEKKIKAKYENGGWLDNK